MWSKNGYALLGILAHAILRKKVIEKADAYQWCMVEKLMGAVPCKSDRHTGEWVCKATTAELKKVGVEKPEEEIFRAKTDRGSNMIKGYEPHEQRSEAPRA